MERLTSKDWDQYIKNGYRVFVGSGAACPHGLMRRFVKAAPRFQDVQVVHIMTLGKTPWCSPKLAEHLKVNAFFLGAGTREAVNSGTADYTPCFLSELPSLFRDDIIPIDVALVMVTPPDEQGFCSLGVSVDVVKSAVESASHVIAQINPSMPRTLGQSFIHKDMIDAFVEIDEPLIEHPTAEMDPVSLKIGKYASLLIGDGSTLQMGIGKIPDAVLACLRGHSDLGLHTEMFSDGVLSLYENGNITNRLKGIHDGKTICTFCFGSRKLYDFVHNNPHIEFHPSEYVNNPAVISRNKNMIAINSAIEVDVTGQVVADSLGNRLYSGIGGQVDFIRGAGMSEGGRPIIALPSTACKGTVSRIVASLTEGSGVVTSRGDVHYVVTEYGIATLRGRSIRERALELIQVAHPKFRDALFEKVGRTMHVRSGSNQSPKTVVELGDVDVIKMKMQDGIDYFLRPLRPSDQHRLQQFFYSHTTETLYQRYRHVPKSMSTETAYRLVNVDQSRDLALCIVELQGPREVVHAVGRYYLDETGDTAEAAFVVSESKRNIGMATALMERIIDIAKKRKLKFLSALVRKDNQSMNHVFRKFRFKQQPDGDPTETLFLLKLRR